MNKTIAKTLKYCLPGGLHDYLRRQYHSMLSLRDPDRRFSIWAWVNPNIHQTTAYTLPNRYPKTFNTAKTVAGDSKQTRLLSFGCSTGDEIESLVRYFPNSKIVGAEINTHRLRECIQRFDNPNLAFIRSNDKNIEAFGPYDVIFAMAVLQRTPHQVDKKKIADLTPIYKFTKFDEQLKKFDSNLNVGGLIVLQNTQYRFRDSSIAEKYDVIPCEAENARLRSFDKNGKIIADEIYNEFIFQKIK